MLPSTPVPATLSLPSIPGIVRSRCHGDHDLIREISRGAAKLPARMCGIPIEIEAIPSAAANLAYTAWACWLPPGMVLEPRLAPLCRWVNAIPSGRKDSPVLLIARSQGQWAFGKEFRPVIANLIHETDPLQSPSGRLLLHADLPGVALRDTLAKGLEWFFASIDPSNQVLLPPATLVLRSGRTTVERHCTIDAAVVFDFINGLRGDRRRVEIALPDVFSASVTIRGAMVWGGWRGAEAVERILTLGARAGKAANVIVRLSDNSDSIDKWRFARQWDVSAQDCPEQSRTDVLTADSPDAAFQDRLWHRVRNSLEREIARRYDADRDRWTPYKEILTSGEAATPLTRVAEPLRDGQPPDSPAGPSNRDSDYLLPFGIESCCIQLAMSVPMLVPHRDAETQTLAPVAEVRKHEEIDRRKETEAMIERLLRLLLPRTSRDEEQFSLSARLTLDRDSRFANVLYRKALGIRGNGHAFVRTIRERFGDRSVLRLELNATLDAGGDGWWVRAANAYRRKANRDAASLAVQKMLRAWLPALARRTPEDFKRCNNAMAMLVYEASTPQVSSDRGEMVGDPREDAVIETLVASAQRPLLRFQPQWSQLLKWAKVRRWADGNAEARDLVIASVSQRPATLRALLVEEARLCDAIGRLLWMMGAVARGGNIPRIQKEAFLRRRARDLAGRLHLAAGRFLPHETADALAPLAVLVGLEAALSGMAAVEWTFRIQGIDAEGKIAGEALVLPLEEANGGKAHAHGSKLTGQTGRQRQRREPPGSGRTNAA